MPYGIVYRIKCEHNAKNYIGQTTRELEKRWKDHIQHSHHPKFPISYAIQKYGVKNFLIEILDTANNQEELNEKEIYWTKQYRAHINEWGYVCKAGQGNGYHSEETKSKMSQTHKGSKRPPRTKEHKRKLSESHADVSGEKNPMFGIRMAGSKNGFYGKKHTEESKQKMSNTHKRRNKKG